MLKNANVPTKKANVVAHEYHSLAPKGSTILRARIPPCTLSHIMESLSSQLDLLFIDWAARRALPEVIRVLRARQHACILRYKQMALLSDATEMGLCCWGSPLGGSSVAEATVTDHCKSKKKTIDNFFLYSGYYNSYKSTPTRLPQAIVSTS